MHCPGYEGYPVGSELRVQNLGRGIKCKFKPPLSLLLCSFLLSGNWSGRAGPSRLDFGSDRQVNRRILFTNPPAPLNPLLLLEMLDAGQDDAVGQC